MNYTALAATSLRLLTDLGQSVTRRTYTVGTYDTATGGVTSSTADTTRKGIAFPFADGKSAIVDTLIQQGDIQVLLDASAPVAQTDHYVVDSSEYIVVSYEPLSPAGTVLLNTLHLRLA